MGNTQKLDLFLNILNQYYCDYPTFKDNYNKPVSDLRAEIFACNTTSDMLVLVNKYI